MISPASSHQEGILIVATEARACILQARHHHLNAFHLDCGGVLKGICDEVEERKQRARQEWGEKLRMQEVVKTVGWDIYPDGEARLSAKRLDRACFEVSAKCCLIPGRDTRPWVRLTPGSPENRAST